MAGAALRRDQHRDEPLPGRVLMEPTRNTLRQGVTVGLIGFGAVAVFYALFDLLAARGGLYTVDLLGRTVFRGLRDPSILEFPIKLDPQAILWYSGLHLVVAVAIGLFVTWLIGQAERRPLWARAIVLAIIIGFVVTIFGVGILSEPIRAVLPWWSIVIANALATILAAGYLFRVRPGLWQRLTPSAA